MPQRVGRSHREEAALEPEEKLGVPWQNQASHGRCRRATAGLLYLPETFVTVLSDETLTCGFHSVLLSGSPHTQTLLAPGSPCSVSAVGTFWKAAHLL